MCFAASETLIECAEAQENGNKYRCPDELYAYEQWCPNDFRRMNSIFKRRADRDEEMYTKEYIDNINSEKLRIKKGRYVAN